MRSKRSKKWLKRKQMRQQLDEVVRRLMPPRTYRFISTADYKPKYVGPNDNL